MQCRPISSLKMTDNSNGTGLSSVELKESRIALLYSSNLIQWVNIFCSYDFICQVYIII